MSEQSKNYLILEAFGQKYERQFDEINKQSGWVSLEGNRVVVTQISLEPPKWNVWVPHMDNNYPVFGEDAEKRAFCIADGFIRQQTSES